jgi:hypothetical protein
MIWHSDPDGHTGHGGVINGQLIQLCRFSNAGGSIISTAQKRL